MRSSVYHYGNASHSHNSTLQNHSDPPDVSGATAPAAATVEVNTLMASLERLAKDIRSAIVTNDGVMFSNPIDAQLKAISEEADDFWSEIDDDDDNNDDMDVSVQQDLFDNSRWAQRVTTRLPDRIPDSDSTTTARSQRAVELTVTDSEDSTETPASDNDDDDSDVISEVNLDAQRDPAPCVPPRNPNEDAAPGVTALKRRGGFKALPICPMPPSQPRTFPKPTLGIRGVRPRNLNVPIKLLSGLTGQGDPTVCDNDKNSITIEDTDENFIPEATKSEKRKDKVITHQQLRIRDLQDRIVALEHYNMDLAIEVELLTNTLNDERNGKSLPVGKIISDDMDTSKEYELIRSVEPPKAISNNVFVKWKGE